jgi:hypothetical protein
MPDTKTPDACALGVALIDAQLLTLCTHAGLLADWIENGGTTPDLGAVERLLAYRRARPEAHAHSEDGTPTRDATGEADLTWPCFDDAAQRMAFALHVPCANAIIALADFFDVHRLSASRTPEVQFLMRLRDAALNADTFRLEQGTHLPHAAYGGLVIDEKLNGHALFGDGTQAGSNAGVIAFGDVVGLLRYLRKLLRSMQSVISAGDAG